MNVQKLFNSFNDLNVLIIGDVMIDNYLWGKVERISPEAPVPIVSVQKKESRLGGAANVAINISAMGANPILCAVIGVDSNGRSFIEMLHQQNMTSEGMLQSQERPTTVKTRIIGNNHQMLRVDEELEEDISTIEKKQILHRIQSILDTKKIDVVIFEDYDKGLLSKSLIEQVVKIANQKNIPIAVDPKKRNFNHYKNVTLFKPNLKELREGMKLDLEKGNLDDIKKAVRKLSTEHKLENVMVTLSEQGMFIVNEKNEFHIPAHIRNIADVSGAGDTVISIAALCLAVQAGPELTATISNLAGGLVCEKVGVVPIVKSDLLEEVKRLKL